MRVPMAHEGNVIVKTRTTRRLAVAFGRVAQHNGRSTAEELRRVMQAHVDAANATPRKDGR